MHAITMTLNRVIWEKFGIKKPPKNEDAQRGLRGGYLNIMESVINDNVFSRPTTFIIPVSFSFSFLRFL